MSAIERTLKTTKAGHWDIPCHSVEEAQKVFKRQNTPEAKAHFHKILKRTAEGE
jgi:hypothetical protein